MWKPFVRVRRPRRHPSLWQLMKLYQINHIGKTFGVSLDEFIREPWRYLGEPSPEIRELWERPHALLPQQLEIAFGNQGQVGQEPTRPHGRAPGAAAKRHRPG